MAGPLSCSVLGLRDVWAVMQDGTWSKMSHGGLLLSILHDSVPPSCLYTPRNVSIMTWGWCVKGKEKQNLLYTHCDRGGSGSFFLSYFQCSTHHRINESVDTHEWLGRIIGLSFDWIGDLWSEREHRSGLLFNCLQTSKGWHGVLSECCEKVSKPWENKAI